MKIVQVVNTLSVDDGGPARNALELNSALNGIDATTSTLYWLRGRQDETIMMSEAPRLMEKASLRKLTLQHPTNHASEGLLAFVKNLNTADIVIIHGYYLFWIPILSMFLAVLGKPYVITPHGSLTLRQQAISARKKQVYEFIAGWSVRRGLKCFVTGSKIEADELNDKFPRARVAVGGVGVRMPSKFKTDNSFHKPIRLLSVSRIAEKKRLDISIRSVKILVDKGYSVTLTIAGTGDKGLTQRLRALGEELQISDHLNFAGQVVGDAKSDLFCGSDIFLLPSDDENFGIGFAEAMAYGLPSVVSNKVASATNMPKGAGVLLNAPTPDSVAEAVLAIARQDNSGLPAVVAREFAERDFSWPAVGAMWAEILSSNVDQAK